MENRKDIAYGEEDGYLFTLIDGPGYKMFLTPLPSVTEETKNEILDYLMFSAHDECYSREGFCFTIKMISYEI